MSKHTKTILLIILLVITIQTFTISALASNNTNGKGKKGKGQGTGETTSITINIYSDDQCSLPMASISWGMLNAGADKNTTCYVRNEGSAALSLSLKTSNWKPRNAFKAVTINWNYNGQPLNPGETTPISIMLSIADRADLTNFTVDITIIGSQ
jgi:hypothetical protein